MIITSIIFVIIYVILGCISYAGIIDGKTNIPKHLSSRLLIVLGWPVIAIPVTVMLCWVAIAWLWINIIRGEYISFIDTGDKLFEFNHEPTNN